MKRLLRLVVVSFSGAIGGALLGAALFGGADIIMEHTGQIRGWNFGPWFSVLIGAIYGLLPGLVIGFIVCVTKSDKVRGCMVGSTICLILTAQLLLEEFRLPPEMKWRVVSLLTDVAPILLGALLGLVLASVSARLTPRVIDRDQVVS